MNRASSRYAQAAILFFCCLFVTSSTAFADDLHAGVEAFLSTHCSDCHADGAAEGGFELAALGTDLSDPAMMSRWIRVHDRVQSGEMPPPDADRPTAAARSQFLDRVAAPLSAAHATSKGTVLRRLNRREYQNTMNDLFGTQLDLEGLLPEDGRSHEFDNVGESLGLSMMHLQQYMDAAGQVLDASIASTSERPEADIIEASYRGTREGDTFIGKKWKELSDGAVVRFSGWGYPTGMMRSTNIRRPGRYRVKITGYAYQSDEPITFSVGGTSFARGSEKPTYGYFSFPPGNPGDKPAALEFETRIGTNYMLQIEPYGINDPQRYKRQSIDDYDGPGLAILAVHMEGPLVDEFPSRGHQLIFDGLERREVPPSNPSVRNKPWYKPVFEAVAENERQDVTNSLLRVAGAAFRQPVTEADIAPYLSLYFAERENGTSIEESLRTAVIAIFCSPRFLYLQEGEGRLDDYELAARLSYFLTRTHPDNELLELAAADRLASDAATLNAQTERLLQDPRFERFLVNFTDAWLDLREMDFTMPDGTLFPEFDAYLRWSMPLETREFVRELIDANLPVTNLVRSEFAMLNSRLARHYDLPSVAGSDIRRVDLPADSIRGGLLTQGAILKVTANGTNSSPVTRGAWVMERILGETPQPPPPGIPGVEPDIRGASTLRDLLDKHRNLVSCRACHQKIDPPGFALESFNPIGGYRQRYRSLGEGERVSLEIEGRKVRYRLGPEVDASGQLPDGRPFADYLEFRDLLAGEADLLARTLTKKLLTFATGRELGFSDRPEIERIVAASREQGHGVRDLIHLVVSSEIFQHK
ncbi:hypothetical protein Mal4_18310 [Maioricimonas rarisocia]|uniref:Cytochrome c domain-containing protein n=1 Tax=Maioricimonas rarisocia TaxID=2528026 RepID=A0A517Z4Z0_9PLAN|nr:DUF1592 domain-containing protein [Maioricimonas rarisocia]QDU37517.1 hypothetical protein Mal4_18310 [Maioricimonas rarisocia]